MPETYKCAGVAALADHYDIFLFDQWGVLHDGMVPSTNAVRALSALKKAGAMLALCTNSGKSPQANISRLERLGFETSQFDSVVTSGLLAADYICANFRGTKMHWVDYQWDEYFKIEYFKRAKIETVSSAAGADFVFLSGWRPLTMSWEVIGSDLTDAAQAGVPLICGNPDRIGYSDGAICFGPGTIADRYSSIGGCVKSFGKPDPEIFVTCLGALHNPRKSRAVMIGDSFETDICGAANIGVDSVLMTSGIHKRLFSDTSPRRALEALSLQFSQGKLFPKYVMNEL